MMRSLTFAVVLVVAVSTLGGCTDFRRALGIEKAPPDEFTVVQNAPLTLPPDYGLRPPHSAGRPATPAPMEEARVTVFRAGSAHPTDPNDQSNALSPGESALVAKAGATGVDPHIRTQVDAETQQVADASGGFIDSLLFWKETKQPGEPVDAVAEAQRLRENAAADKPVTDNEPTLERTQRSILQGLL